MDFPVIFIRDFFSRPICRRRDCGFTFAPAYPYILQLPFVAEHNNEISILLVGSTATGLCTDTSDVDICLLCHEQLFNVISKDTNWSNGRPTEIIIENTQLHYYAVSYESLEKKIAEYDDVTFYVYGNAIALNDNSKIFVKLQNLLFNDDIKTERKNKALDILVRRNRALKQILEKEPDPILRTTVGLELIELLLKAIALFDNSQFDKRKRFYSTALTGNLGMKIQSKIDYLIASLSEISRMECKEKSFMFMQMVDECIAVLK